MNSYLVLLAALMLLMSLTRPSVTETSAASVLVSPKGVCASPGDFYQLKWIAKNADPAETLQVHCRRLDGSLIEHEHDERYTIDESKCCDNRTRKYTCALGTTLTVLHLTDHEDSGSCDCDVVKVGVPVGVHDETPGDSTANVWVRNDTVFSLSEDDITITPGQGELTVSFEIKCDFDGTFEVIRENGDGTPLKHIGDWDNTNPRQAPYIRLNSGQIPVLCFPAPGCGDQGLYRVTYRASRFYKPVETTRYLQVRVDDTSCPGPGEIVDTLDTTLSSAGTTLSSAGESNQVGQHCPKCDAAKSDQVYQVAIGVLGGVLLLVVIAACGYLFYRKRQLTARKRGLENRSVTVPLNDSNSAGETSQP
ncbi:uncharacterized protein LOC119740605 [Patiria miniata]|uniref:Uncharacterized protein n=1 Tax=Patiria miniata TaxID=46514 RepID=A0A914B8Z0_PATMI|nr:uncharacterized protein LOC119740605 [Patiria miniata]